jgi:hypothetical protein
MKKASDSQETKKKKKTRTHTYKQGPRIVAPKTGLDSTNLSDCGWVESACLSECVSAKIADAKFCDLLVS